MEEIDPIKHIIIQKISSLIKNAIPGGEVEVYGSHATKLCLHWSDVDLVLKPQVKQSTPIPTNDGTMQDGPKPFATTPTNQGNSLRESSMLM